MDCGANSISSSDMENLLLIVIGLLGLIAVILAPWLLWLILGLLAAGAVMALASVPETWYGLLTLALVGIVCYAAIWIIIHFGLYLILAYIVIMGIMALKWGLAKK
jgi:hypothetical protein